MFTMSLVSVFFKVRDMNKKFGFTLVELSIVLLIIGLIIGGITAGTSLIKQAKVRSIISEQSNYVSSINVFRVQFNFLPGDFNNASSMWGTACDPTPTNCNGNGDGLIQYSNESFRIWQHMALAGIINFNYVAAVPEPIAKYGNSYWRVEDNGSQVYTVPPGTRNSLEFMGGTSLGSTFDIISTVDAYAIDLKVDDGMASNGKIIATSGSGGILQSDGVTIASSATYNSNAAVYNIANPNILCNRIYYYIQ
jgi:prepilin-type N-terminal cleavage/methylation domain-containing protein